MKKYEKMRFKFLTATTAMAFLTGIACCSTALAAVGWVNQEGQWEYHESDNTPVTDTWRKSGEEWYWLNSEGKMAKDCMVEDGDVRYYLDAEGRMVKNQWQWVDSEDEGAWYYFGNTGKAYRRGNGASSFKKKIGEKAYAFDEDGKMLAGWIDREGNALEDSEDPFVEGMYYAREDGALLTNQWLEYGSIGEGTGGSHLFSSVADRSYEDYDKMWLYFNETSKKVRSSGERLLQKDIDGVTYGFDENGIMLPWWSKITLATPAGADTDGDGISNGNTENNRKEGYLAEDSNALKYYSGYDGGMLLRDKWFYMYPSENLNAGDYNDGEYSWWRTDASGKVYTDKIKKINGRQYAFDGIGRMRTGFLLFEGKSHFVGQYDIDTHRSEHFITGDIGGIERADLYLFSPDELNDGSMQVGGEIQVELEDGVFTFGFSPSGKAYGNRNEMKKKNDCWYINGLRLEADEEFGYGVVKVKEGDETYYQVVKTNGKIVTGKKKILKDRDGGYYLILSNRYVGYVTDEDKPVWHSGAYTIDGVERTYTGFWAYDKDKKGEDRYLYPIAGYDFSFRDDVLEDLLPQECQLNFGSKFD